MLAFVRRARALCLRDRFWLRRSLFGVALCASCGFPEYQTVPANGAAGAGGVGLSAGFSGSTAGITAVGGVSGGATAGSGGSTAGPDGGAGAQAGSAPALMPCSSAAGAAGASAVLASHCTNGKKDGDETGLDCGGPVCPVCLHNEACQHGSDCVSGSCTSGGTCQEIFGLEFKTTVTARNTNTLDFQLQLTYRDAAPIMLQDISLRYYFARGDVADPVVPYATHAVLNGTELMPTSAGPQALWNIVRVLPDSVAQADSYLEITFPTARKMITNDVLELTQSIQDGTAAGSQFDQLTHYSFQNVTTYTIEDKATVYRQGALAWGKPAPYTLPEQCFYTAVNFAGEAFSDASVDFRAGTDPMVQFTGTTFHGDSSTGLTPPADSAMAPMLESAAVLDTASATLLVPDGQYWLYPYIVSGDGSDTADLLVQGQKVDTFSAEIVGAAPAWVKLGPYAVAVANGKLVLSATGGALRLAGAELYQAAQ